MSGSGSSDTAREEVLIGAGAGAVEDEAVALFLALLVMVFFCFDTAGDVSLIGGDGGGDDGDAATFRRCPTAVPALFAFPAGGILAAAVSAADLLLTVLATLFAIGSVFELMVCCCCCDAAAACREERRFATGAAASASAARLRAMAVFLCTD